MGKFNDIDKESRSFVRFAIIATLLALLFLLIRKDNIVRWIQAGFTIHRQQQQIEYLQQQNADLDEKINNLSTDRDSVEKYARETYFFAGEGDDVYIVEP